MATLLHWLLAGAMLLSLLAAAHAQAPVAGPAAPAALAAGAIPAPSPAPAWGAAPGAAATGDRSQQPTQIRNDTTQPDPARPADKQADSGEDNPGAATLREPLVENEFQRFVASATGQRLPLFGQCHFRNAPRTFAPLDQVPVPVPADYVLGPGDEIYIRAWGSIDVDYRATIDRNGLINIPRVGSLRVTGVKAGDIEPFLKTRFAREFKNFNFSVTLGQPASRLGVWFLAHYVPPRAEATFSRSVVGVASSSRHKRTESAHAR